MALILSIETATIACSVALHENGFLRVCADLLLKKAHSGSLSQIIGKILSIAGENYQKIDAVAVSKGPGSFTGLRIGASTAKGLCFALDRPLIAIETLQILAASLKSEIGKDYLLCPMIDARRMEVYSAIYNQKLEKLTETQAIVINQNFYHDLLYDKHIFFFGDGAAKCKPYLESNPKAHFKEKVMPSANYMGWLAFLMYEQKKFEDLAYFEPYYLKDFKPKRTKPLNLRDN